MLESSSGLPEWDTAGSALAGNGGSTPPDESHPLVHILYIVEQACAEAQCFKTQAGTPTLSKYDLRVIRAALLQSLYAFACEEHLVEQLRYNALYRWFVGLVGNDVPCSPEIYSRALAQLRASQPASTVFRTALVRAHAFAALTPNRFRVDHNLLELWTQGEAEALISTPEADGSDRSMPLSRRPGRLERARSVILRRIDDPTLGPDEVAAELCMSRRSLYLMFEKHGLTPTKAIREIRLDSCRKILSDARHQHRKISDIAMDFGFDDPATFSRQYKTRYGVSPREQRCDRASSVSRADARGNQSSAQLMSAAP